MSQRPTIFTVTAFRDEEADVWVGSCDAVPMTAEAESLDLLLIRLSEMAADLLPANHPDLDPSTVFLQLSVLQDIGPRAAAA